MFAIYQAAAESVGSAASPSGALVGMAGKHHA